MKHLLVLASLASVMASAPAFAERAKPPMLTIRYGVEGASLTKTVEVYSSGSYIVSTFDASGSQLSSTRVRLDRSEYTQLRAAIVEAPWTETQSQIACFAYSPSYTQYVVQGTVRFTEQTCSGVTVDAATLRSIATIESVLGLR